MKGLLGNNLVKFPGKLQVRIDSVIYPRPEFSHDTESIEFHLFSFHTY